MIKPLRYLQVDPLLPESLKPLQDIAKNLWWLWNQEAIQIFRRIDGRLWEESGHNPVKLLGLIPQDTLDRLDHDLSFRAQLDRVKNDLEDYMGKGTWFARDHFPPQQAEIAYFSAEFGLAESLPIYSGGLGVLAGDHLKSASDLGVPLIGIGLLYQRGYFQQYLNADGWQQEYYPQLDFSTLPLTEVTDQAGHPLLIDINFPAGKLWIKVWKLQVGRVPLLLLDTNLSENLPEDREITDQLYGGDNEHRIRQEIVLGIGGVRALESLHLSPTVYHINEGHAAFLSLERIRRLMAEEGLSFQEAVILVRQTSVFTTHTPVPAGIDRFPRHLMEKYLQSYSGQFGLRFDEFFALGCDQGERCSEFNMALMAMRFSSNVNGVSRLHAEISRKMWLNSWKGIPFDEIPIHAITNGVHTRSWISAEMCDLYNRYLGQGWLEEPANHACWSNVEEIPDGELWRTHELRRERMISFVRRRLKEQLKRRGALPREIETANEVLNSEHLTVGFARRFAAYKRGTMIFRNIKRLKEILSNSERPVQLIISGKAHPHDSYGKELIKTIIHLARDVELRGRVVFLENYDLEAARYLVQGVDVWLNTPRRPLEASGTSGMKVVPNGGLNLSVLDGWWCEGYTPETGWAIGGGEEYDNHDYQDEVEANALYDILEKEIAPLFYDRANDGIPRKWVAMMKQSMKNLAPVFNSNRMVQEYVDRFYIPSFRQSKILRHQDLSELKSLTQWQKRLCDNWGDIRILEINSQSLDRIGVNQTIEIESRVFLGNLQPDDLSVELYIGKISPAGTITDSQAIRMNVSSRQNGGVCLYRCRTSFSTSGRLGYSVRVLPGHQSLVHPYELALITWADGDL